MSLAEPMYAAMWRASSPEDPAPPEVEFAGQAIVRAAFAVTDFAAAAVGSAAGALVRLLEQDGSKAVGATVDRGLASAWFADSLRAEGWKPPSRWDPVAGDYEAADGWIRLHTNAARHRDAVLGVLGVPAERDAVSEAVWRWSAVELQEAVVAAGGCAAAMRSLEEWRAHPQGAALLDEPLVESGATGVGRETNWRPDPRRPLRGVRVLDLTRILAGPVATRFLAGYGADVLRIDPPEWNEALVPEVTLGKRCARLDAKSAEGIAQLRRLLGECDVLVHGYRPGALDALGLSAFERDALRPGLIDVSLDAWGYSGPWATRRGYDSLVQMSSGIADRGRIWAGTERPTPLPFQALDEGTGYLLAASVVVGLTRRLATGRGWRARLALVAATARFLVENADLPDEVAPDDPGEAPLAAEIEQTVWGPARRVCAPVEIGGAPMRWELPATALGSHPPNW